MKPIARFVALTPGTRSPMRADATLEGAVPLRAYRYCEPFTQASAFGWTLFSPIDFRVIWNGGEFLWRPEGVKNWHPVRMAQMPGYPEWFARHVPERYRRLEVPFLTAFPERGVLQVWSGWAAQTRRNWALLIRGPANTVRPSVFDCLEGIVQHDWWFGPVIGNLQFRKSDQEVAFTRATPLFLAQPIPHYAYSAKLLQSVAVAGAPEDLSDSDWKALEDALYFGADQKPLGAYAKVARKREGR